MADAVLATLGVVLALAGICIAVVIVSLVATAVIGWAWRRKMLRDAAKSEQPRSRHNYTPTNGPENPVPPQGGSGTVPFERVIAIGSDAAFNDLVKRGRDEIINAFKLPPNKVYKR